MAGALVYVFVRFGLGVLSEALHGSPRHVSQFAGGRDFRRVGFFACLGRGHAAACVQGPAGVVLGYLSHLILDEIYSVEWKRGWLRIKKSFGTAIKMYSTKSLWPNLSTYLKLGLLSYVVFYEPSWMHEYRAERAERWKRHAVEQPAEVELVQELPVK